MKKKLILSIFFFCLIFSLKSVFSTNAIAATIQGYLDNRQGSISVNVSVTYKNEAGVVLSTPPAYTVAAGATRFVTEYNLTTNNYPSISWSTNCNTGSSITSGTGGVYSFTDQNIRCATTNSTVTITGTSCPQNSGVNNGRVDWQVSNSTSANISGFKVYRSLTNDKNSDTSPASVTFTTGTVNYFSDHLTNSRLAGLASGQWYVWVEAIPNTPDAGNTIITPAGQFTCGAGVTNPSNLNTNVSCSGGQNKVDFSWTGATPGTFTYVVKSKLGSDPGSGSADALWNGPTATPNPSSNTYVSTTNIYMAVAGTYYWRVKATRDSDGVIVFSTSSNFTTPTNCAANYSAPAIDGVKTCGPTTVPNSWDSGTYNWQTGGVNADNVVFKWGRVYPEAEIDRDQEFIEYTTDSSFSTGITSVKVYMDPAPANRAAAITIGTAQAKTFTDGATYYWRVKTKMKSGQWLVSAPGRFVAPTYCANATSFSMAATGAGSYAYCAGTESKIHLAWMDTSIHPYYDPFPATNYAQYTVNRTPASSWLGAGDYGFSTDIGVVYGSDIGSTFSFYAQYWSSQGGGAYVNSSVVSLTYLDCSGVVVPAAPVDLQVSAGCFLNGSFNDPAITFSFTDKSNNESSFALEVSTESFNSDITTNGTNTWGTKIITSSPSDTTNSNRAVPPFIWKSTVPLDSGDANPQDLTPSNDKIPIDGTVYYWRVRAVNASGTSVYMYSDGSTASTVFPINRQVGPTTCRNRYNLSARIDTTTLRHATTGQTGSSFQIGDTLKVDVIVTNNGPMALPGTAFVAGQQLWFYYKRLPTACTDSVPTDAVGASQSNYNLSSLFTDPGSTLAPGSSVTLPVTFTIDSTIGSATAYANVAPTCSFSDGGIDPVKTNNVSNGVTYAIGVNRFFETIGGDVGAKVKITSTADGSCQGKYQSDYIIASGSVSSNIKGKTNITAAIGTGTITSGVVTGVSFTNRGLNYPSSGNTVLVYGGGGSGAIGNATVAADGSVSDITFNGNGGSGYTSAPQVRVCPPLSGGFKITNYSNGQVATDSVYDYFASKFRNKAAVEHPIEQCSLTTGTYNGLYYCSGDMNIAGATVTGNAVFFIDHDLNIANGQNVTNLYLSGDSTAVYIVKGNINLSTFVQNLHGVFIARNSFNDCSLEVNYCQISSTTYILKVKGALYVDGKEGGKMNLQRYFLNPLGNITNPSDQFIYEPKYLIALTSLLASADVGWREVNP